MRKILLILALVFLLPLTAHAQNEWHLQWNASSGADGYILFYKGYNDATFQSKDLGNVTQHFLESDTDLALILGNRYCFKLIAYNVGGNSGDSDTVCWTYPLPMQTIELPSAPNQLILNWPIP